MPWQVVLVTPADAAPAATGVRLLTGNGSAALPLDGHTVIFARAPHAGCTAVSRNGGLAACPVMDTHGDGPHPGEDKAPVVATFTGAVRQGVQLLPTTLVLRAGR